MATDAPHAPPGAGERGLVASPSVTSFASYSSFVSEDSPWSSPPSSRAPSPSSSLSSSRLVPRSPWQRRLLLVCFGLLCLSLSTVAVFHMLAADGRLSFSTSFSRAAAHARARGAGDLDDLRVSQLSRAAAPPPGSAALRQGLGGNPLSYITWPSAATTDRAPGAGACPRILLDPQTTTHSGHSPGSAPDMDAASSADVDGASPLLHLKLDLSPRPSLSKPPAAAASSPSSAAAPGIPPSSSRLGLNLCAINDLRLVATPPLAKATANNDPIDRLRAGPRVSLPAVIREAFGRPGFIRYPGGVVAENLVWDWPLRPTVHGSAAPALGTRRPHPHIVRSGVKEITCWETYEPSNPTRPPSYLDSSAYPVNTSATVHDVNAPANSAAPPCHLPNRFPVPTNREVVMDIDVFADLAVSLGSQPIVVLPAVLALDFASPAERAQVGFRALSLAELTASAEQLVAYLSKHPSGINTTLYEIGNEPARAKEGKPGAQPLTTSQYCQILATMAPRVRAAAAPKPVQLGFSTGDDDQDLAWAAELYQRCPQHFDYLSVHLYPFAEGHNAAAGAEISTSLDRLRRLAATAAEHGHWVAVTEFSVHSWGTHAHAFVPEALRSVDMMLQLLASNQVHFALYWTSKWYDAFRNTPSVHSLFNYAHQPSPVATAFGFIAPFLGQELFPCDTVDARTTSLLLCMGSRTAHQRFGADMLANERLYTVFLVNQQPAAARIALGAIANSTLAALTGSSAASVGGRSSGSCALRMATTILASPSLSRTETDFRLSSSTLSVNVSQPLPPLVVPPLSMAVLHFYCAQNLVQGRAPPVAREVPTPAARSPPVANPNRSRPVAVSRVSSFSSSATTAIAIAANPIVRPSTAQHILLMGEGYPSVHTPYFRRALDMVGEFARRGLEVSVVWHGDGCTAMRQLAGTVTSTVTGTSQHRRPLLEWAVRDWECLPADWTGVGQSPLEAYLHRRAARGQPAFDTVLATPWYWMPINIYEQYLALPAALREPTALVLLAEDAQALRARRLLELAESLPFLASVRHRIWLDTDVAGLAARETRAAQAADIVVGVSPHVEAHTCSLVARPTTHISSAAAGPMRTNTTMCMSWVWGTDLARDLTALPPALPESLAAAVPAATSLPTYAERDSLILVADLNNPTSAFDVLWLLEEVLPELVRQLPRDLAFPITITGSGMTSNLGQLLLERVAVCARAGGPCERLPVQFLPSPSDETLTELVKRARLFLAPSLAPVGVSTKLFYAMCSGTPAVATHLAQAGLQTAQALEAVAAAQPTARPQAPQWLEQIPSAAAFAAHILGNYTAAAEWSKNQADGLNLCRQRLQHANSKSTDTLLQTLGVLRKQKQEKGVDEKEASSPASLSPTSAQIDRETRPQEAAPAAPITVAQKVLASAEPLEEALRLRYSRVGEMARVADATQTFDVVFGVSSALSNFAARQACRTWAQAFGHPRILVRFIVGRLPKPDLEVLAELEREAAKYGDIVVVPEIIESYSALAQKSAVLLRWVECELHGRYKFAFKTDDDMFLRIDLLSQVLVDAADTIAQRENVPDEDIAGDAVRTSQLEPQPQSQSQPQSQPQSRPQSTNGLANGQVPRVVSRASPSTAASSSSSSSSSPASLPLIYAGNMAFWRAVLMDKTSKWYSDFARQPDRPYPPFARGHGYALSAPLVERVLSAPRLLNCNGMEDVCMALWIFDGPWQQPLQADERLHLVHFSEALAPLFNDLTVNHDVDACDETQLFKAHIKNVTRIAAMTASFRECGLVCSPCASSPAENERRRLANSNLVSPFHVQTELDSLAQPWSEYLHFRDNEATFYRSLEQEQARRAQRRGGAAAHHALLPWQMEADRLPSIAYPRLHLSETGQLGLPHAPSGDWAAAAVEGRRPQLHLVSSIYRPLQTVQVLDRAATATFKTEYFLSKHSGLSAAREAGIEALLRREAEDDTGKDRPSY